MRGRTNLLGFNEDFINAYIDQYEVKAGNSVTAGDFVELFSQTDAMSIVDGSGKNFVTDFVKIANLYYVAGLLTQIYLFKLNDNELEFVDIFSIPQDIDTEGDIISICYDSNYIFVTKGAEELNKKLYVYKFDSINESLTYIANTTIHGGKLTLLDDGIFINTQHQDFAGYSKNAQVDKIYNSVVSISVDENNGTVSISSLYLDPSNEMFPATGTSYKYYKYHSVSEIAISPDGTKILIESSSNTHTSSGQTMTEFLRQFAAFSYDKNTQTFTKIGIITINKPFYGFGVLKFINNRYCLMAFNSYYNMNYCPSISFIDFNSLNFIGDSIYYSEFSLNNLTSADQRVNFKILMMKDENVILTSPTVYDNDSSDYVFLFIGVGLNEFLDIVFENNVYAVDFQSDASSNTLKQRLLNRIRLGKTLLYDEENLKYKYVFPTFDTADLNPHNILSNEFDVSNLPYAEMTSDKPKLVASYIGKINGVAKTSGNAGELIDVYVPY